MFRGLYEHSIDAKGRTSLPARFRDVLAGLRESGETSPAKAHGDRLIVTTGIDRCLVAYPPAEWEAFEARLAALSQFDANVVQLKRLYVAGATECALDKHSRLLIPPMLREYAGLKRDVVWAGMVTTIELWSKGSWNQQVVSSLSNRDAIVRALSELGL
ncbi:MAG: division/cell wall cluster transcriptional repressor MraZ [Myxococcota bacterium]